MFTSWQTTLAGIISIMAAGAVTVPSLKPYAEVIGLLSAGAVGLLAKDKNVTGGTKPSTVEAASRAKSPPLG